MSRAGSRYRVSRGSQFRRRARKFVPPIGHRSRFPNGKSHGTSGFGCPPGRRAVASALRNGGRMKRLIAATIAGLLMSGASVWASPPDADNKRKQKKAEHHRTASAENGDHARADVRVTFSSRDVRLIRTHYAPRYRKLPPGLQKKLARTGSLPPGWQKKME